MITFWNLGRFYDGFLVKRKIEEHLLTMKLKFEISVMGDNTFVCVLLTEGASSGGAINRWYALFNKAVTSSCSSPEHENDFD